MMANLIQALNARKARAIVSLILIYVSAAMNWFWLWGVLLLLWAIGDLITEQTWLSESIAKRSNPVFFYAIVITWLVFGFYLIASPFAYLLR